MASYDEMFDKEAAAAGPQPGAAPTGYDALFDQEVEQQRAQSRAVIELALKDDPEIAAERQRLSKTSGLPLRLIERNLDEIRVKERARAIDLVRMAQDSPVLARQMVDPNFTTVAVDDLPVLSQIEKAVGSALRYTMGAAPGGGLPADLPRAAVDLGLGATAGVGEMIFNIAGVLNDVVGFDGMAASARATANRSREARQSFGLQPDSSTGKAVKSGLGSAGTSLAVLPLGLTRGLFATAEAAGSAVAGIMASGVAADAYLQAREQGKSGPQAALFGVPQGVFEYVFEKIPASKLFGDIAANTSLMKTLRTQALSEGWTEQVTTVAQDFNEWMNLNPNKTVGEFLLERPEAAYQTLIATLVGVGVQTTTIRGIDKAIQKATDTRLELQQDAFTEILKTAGQSALRERSPDQFRAYVQAAVDQNEGAPKSIYVDAEVLNQLPEDVLNQLPESVRAQLPAELAKNGSVEIPMADVLTLAPGTPLEQMLNDNARMTPDGLSRADVLAAGDKLEVLKQEAERVVQQAADQEAMRASAEVVRSSILTELNTAGRHGPAVNEGMATWASAFYTTMASRVGMTPEAFYQQYRLRILNAPSAAASGPVMDQPGVPAFDNWFGDSQVRDAEGKPLVVYHGSNQAFDTFDPTKEGSGQGYSSQVPGHWFTTSERMSGAFGENTIQAYLTIRNPYVIPAKKYMQKFMYNGQDPVAFRKKLEKQGFDGIQIVADPEYVGGRGPSGTDEWGHDNFVAFRPEQIKSAIGNNGNFDPQNPSILEQSVNETAAELLVQHNLSAENLLHAKRMGGIPVPSLAVTKKSAPMQNFGEITLLGTKEMADPKGYAGTKVFGADIYSPRYPSVEFKLDNKAQRKMNETLAPFRKEGDREMYGSEIRRPDDITSYKPFKRWAADRYGVDENATTWQQLKESANALVREIGAGERIFQGFTYSGNRKYIDHTLDNVVKILKKELRGGENFNYGVGSLRAKFTPQFKSVAQIQKAKNRLVDKAAFDAIKKEIDAEFIALSEDLDLSLEQTSEVIEDSAKMGAKRSLTRAFNDYRRGVEPTDEQAIAVGDFARKLATLPTEYFEAKILRAVDVAEFAAAVVPADASQDVLDALTERGVTRIAKYDPAVDGDRTAKINQFNDLFFQERTGGPTPRGTFNPRSLELVLNPNANLSTFFHETGHFFLEVMADIASQPNAPAQIVEDMGTFLKWAGVKDLATWNALDLDGKRQYHERWAESIEQYVMEGKAPSVELQPLMRRFATWLKSVYGSIKRFLEMRGQVAAAGGEALGQAADDSEAQADAVYQEIAADQEMIDAIEVYMVSGDPPEGALNDKLLAYINRLPPVPADSYLTFYRNQPRAARPWARGWSSWTINEDQTRYFGGRDFEVLKRKGVHGLDLNRLGEYRTRVTGEYSQYGSQGEWLVLNESVFNQNPAAQPGPQMALNDDIRRVMDRMLATDEQIAQANEVAGLVPDVDADASAAERLAKRSIADLKWSVKARDQVIAKLQKAAKAIEKAIREEVTAEVDATPEMRAKRALDALKVTPDYAALLEQHKAQRKAAEATTRAEVKAALLAENPDAKGIVIGQLLMKNRRDIDNKVDAAMIKWDAANPVPKRPVNATDTDVATIADSFGFESVDAMMAAIDAYGPRREAIDGITERRMLEEHGDLIDERAIQQAANEAVHNEARARSLASELRTQAEMLNPRADTGETNAKGSKITVNALVEAAKQFAANVVSKTIVRDLKNKAWQHTAAERRAAKRWQEATAAGKTEEAVKAKQDQMLNHAAAKAALDAQAEVVKIRDFFGRVVKGNDETVVEKGRDADIVNAARAVLSAYGVQSGASKGADAYLEIVQRQDPDAYNAIAPMVAAATQNAQPLEALSLEQLQALHESIEAMWFLAKASREMEVDGDRVDLDDAETALYDRAEEIGIPDRIPGEGSAVTGSESRIRKLRELRLNVTRVEQWAEAMDGKAQGAFWRYIFLPIKAAADRVRARRVDAFRSLEAATKKLAPSIRVGKIEAPEIGYTFGDGKDHNGVGMAELLPALLNVGNPSNKRKLLLGRGWATENPDGTLDTTKWDAFIQRLHDEGVLTQAHWDYVQSFWDVLESLKKPAQEAHRQVYGRYFSEVTAEPVVTPFGTYRGGYYPAQTDTDLVTDMALKKLAEAENENMSYSFPSVAKGFTKSRVEAYTRPLKLDINVAYQHIDKVILFSEMQPAAQGVGRLLKRKKVSQPLERIVPGLFEALLVPWSNDAAKQITERPVLGDGGFNRGATILRARVGMQLMMGNLLNAAQQVSGIPAIAAKIEADGLKRSFLRKALVKWTAHPKKFSEDVWSQSIYMKDRAENEVAAMADTMKEILFNPTLLQSGEAWTRKHSYFLQTWMDNRVAPIAWQAGYDAWRASQPKVDTTGMAPKDIEALEARQHRDAVLYADGLVRQTQGSQLPEDVSRFERGIGFVRLFTQFAGYFNMQANTNAASIVKLADQGGLKNNYGRGFYILMMGLLAPIWIAEAIGLAMRGGAEDDDEDGAVWDDWLRSIFGMGTFRGLVAMLPGVGQVAVATVNRFNDNPADDRLSVSPVFSVFESLGSGVYQIGRGVSGEEVNEQKLLRDLSLVAGTATGLPLFLMARPTGYIAGVLDDRIDPTSPADAVRGVITGTASPESKVP